MEYSIVPFIHGIFIHRIFIRSIHSRTIHSFHSFMEYSSAPYIHGIFIRSIRSRNIHSFHSFMEYSFAPFIHGIFICSIHSCNIHSFHSFHSCNIHSFQSFHSSHLLSTFLSFPLHSEEIREWISPFHFTSWGGWMWLDGRWFFVGSYPSLCNSHMFDLLFPPALPFPRIYFLNFFFPKSDHAHLPAPSIKWSPGFDGRCLPQGPAIHKFPDINVSYGMLMVLNLDWIMAIENDENTHLALKYFFVICNQQKKCLILIWLFCYI
jgi:hypothetical protein